MATETIDSIAPRNLIEHEGFIVDEETGEVVGLKDQGDMFVPQTRAEVDWVMEKRLQAEAAVLAVDRTAEVIAARAVIENAERIKKDAQRRVDYLDMRFLPDLHEFARREMDGKKERTLKTIFGKICLRVVKGGVRVRDAEAALRYARVCAPGSIKITEAFQISKLTLEERAEIEEFLRKCERDPDYSTEDDTALVGFQLEPDRETCEIESGVS